MSESFDGAQDERMGFDVIEDFPFMLRLSKHSELFQQPAEDHLQLAHKFRLELIKCGDILCYRRTIKGADLKLRLFGFFTQLGIMPGIIKAFCSTRRRCSGTPGGNENTRSSVP